MCKFRYNFLQLYFSLPRVRGKSGIVTGQSGFNKKDKDIRNYIS